MRILLTMSLVCATCACSPELPSADETIGQDARNAPFPKLAPLGQLLADADSGSKVEFEARSISDRVANLKARAAALQRRSVIDEQTRQRLRRAVATRSL